MRRSRRNHTSAFKARVALAAVRGDKTLAEQFDVHSNQITQWKTQLLERAAEMFSTPAGTGGRSRVARLMRLMGIEALYRRKQKNTSRRHPEHAVFPYLLRGLTIDRPNQVWAMDITYLPMKRGFVYLAVVLDWASRRVLSWRLSNSQSADFCVAAVEEAIARFGKPEIFNTDQGSQFTSTEFVTLLKDHKIRISMDGKGCWGDNVFVERLWRTVKYEEVYLHAYDPVSEARAALTRYFAFYNQRRPHASLDRQTPDTVYFRSLPAKLAA